MATDDEPTLSIGELADRGGVSRRTVRYYVQRGLLEAPTGLGRGRHYTRRHLETLLRIRELQERGVPLASIPARLEGRPADHAHPDVPAAAPRQSTWTRVSLGDGVELHLRDRRLDDEQVRALRDAITEVIGREGSP